uniref:Uncharacterized protein n=1 Tax=Tanacetum cinerariifolium TaxID=118510 RepID=A0A6L2N9M6_TANCI|nr:hypothetical protein [Tanacetum cinerariifolium]
MSKRARITRGVVMEIHNRGCVWITIREAVEEDKEDDEVDEAARGGAGHEGDGGSVDMYRNMSQGDWQIDPFPGYEADYLPVAIRDTCLQAMSTASAPLKMTLSDCSCSV